LCVLNINSNKVDVLWVTFNSFVFMSLSYIFFFFYQLSWKKGLVLIFMKFKFMLISDTCNADRREEYSGNIYCCYLLCIIIINATRCVDLNGRGDVAVPDWCNIYLFEHGFYQWHKDQICLPLLYAEFYMKRNSKSFGTLNFKIHKLPTSFFLWDRCGY
jgi:hypothetical protein